MRNFFHNRLQILPITIAFIAFFLLLLGNIGLAYAATSATYSLVVGDTLTLTYLNHAGGGTCTNNQLKANSSIVTSGTWTGPSSVTFSMQCSCPDACPSQDLSATQSGANIELHFEDGHGAYDHNDLIAKFTLNHTPTYTLTTVVAPSAGGSIVRSSLGPTYASGMAVTLTPSPATGYQFSRWTGADRKSTRLNSSH